MYRVHQLNEPMNKIAPAGIYVEHNPCRSRFTSRHGGKPSRCRGRSCACPTPIIHETNIAPAWRHVYSNTGYTNLKAPAGRHVCSAKPKFSKRKDKQDKKGSVQKLMGLGLWRRRKLSESRIKQMKRIARIF